MNRVVLITGGSSGIGKITAQMFNDNGDNVFTIARNYEQKTDKDYVCDVSNEESVKQIVEEIGNKNGVIDVIVNCAGYGISGALELTPSADAEKIFQINVMGVFYVNKYALKFMKSGGKIINISSTCALFPLPYRALYCATKSALNMLSFGQAMECKPFNVQVTSICPGEVKTNFTKNRIKITETNSRYGKRIERAKDRIDKHENKRMPPEKVAKVIFNCSNKKKMKPMIIVGGKYKLLYFFSKIFPLKVLLFFTEKFYGGHSKED